MIILRLLAGLTALGISEAKRTSDIRSRAAEINDNYYKLQKKWEQKRQRDLEERRKYAEMFEASNKRLMEQRKRESEQ